MGKIRKYLILLSLTLLICITKVAYAEGLNEQYYIDIINKVYRLELEIDKLQQKVETLGGNSKKYDSMYYDVKEQCNKLVTKIELLAEEQKHNSQMLNQKIEDIEIPNNRTSRILNMIITIGTLSIGAIGVASVSGYIKNKIEEIATEKIARELKDEISKEVYEKVYNSIYKQYSDSLIKTNSKINEFYQYKSVLDVLKKMGDKVE